MAEHIEHRRGGLEVGLLRLIDHRVHNVRLPSLLELSIHKLEDARTSGFGSERRSDRKASWWAFVERAEIQIAVQRESERAWNRRSTHEKHIGAFSLLSERRSLLDAEPVLLVDDRQPQLTEVGALLDQRMCTHRNEWCA